MSFRLVAPQFGGLMALHRKIPICEPVAKIVSHSYFNEVREDDVEKVVVLESTTSTTTQP